MGTTRVKRVLIVGWDGVRDDERRAARTPHLDGLAAHGFEAAVRVHEANPTISGPVWTTVATGVHSDRHGVLHNDLRPHDHAALPDVLTLIRRADRAATTYAAAGWAPLVTADSGGPLFADGDSYYPVAPAGADKLAAQAAMDADVVARTMSELRDRDHSAVFSYVGLPDEIGHAEGVTARYRASIETCDDYLGSLLEVIDARPSRADEDWLIIVTTDHGHRDEGDHGGDSDEERSAWLVAAGPGVVASCGSGVDHADIPVTVLDFLGVEIDGDLAGRPFGLRDTR